MKHIYRALAYLVRRVSLRYQRPCSANQVKAEESLTPPNVVRMSAIGKGKLHHRDSYIPNRPRTSPCSEASLTALRPQHKIKIVTVDNDIDSSRETTLNYIQDELRALCLKRGELHTQVSCRPTPMMAVQMINESQDTRDQPPSTSMPLAIREADAPSVPSAPPPRRKPVYLKLTEDPVESGLLHHMLNHAPVSRIKRTLQVTKGLRCDQVVSEPHCGACATARARKHKMRDHGRPTSDVNQVAYLYSIGEENLLTTTISDPNHWEEYDSEEDEPEPTLCSLPNQGGSWVTVILTEAPLVCSSMPSSQWRRGRKGYQATEWWTRYQFPLTSRTSQIIQAPRGSTHCLIVVKMQFRCPNYEKVRRC